MGLDYEYGNAEKLAKVARAVQNIPEREKLRGRVRKWIWNRAKLGRMEAKFLADECSYAAVEYVKLDLEYDGFRVEWEPAAKGIMLKISWEATDGTVDDSKDV